ncbi:MULTISPECIES: FAD-dependent oxidoreductase [unclassified Aliihoeflea]|uniref:FAD-dependent oxidoreductase n=1 Tax=unclassified Aliihoeflea TaxID=2628764 RepID=UPI0004643FB3|nr:MULTISPECIES: FAD-dependent oxidoreductase [unclassified Aliihoeflea]MCO6388896.1 NAD(P)-binding domain-containing protein [Aliihoeflea sp. 40Bstr573]
MLDFPVAIIGAGPVGLAAAAHLVERGLKPVIFERGEDVGASMLEWGHVRVFSPWRYNIDQAAKRLLENEGWVHPDPDAYPTGREIVDCYLRPIALTAPIAAGLHRGSEVTGITRRGHDLMSSSGREAAPFVVRYTSQGGARSFLAQAVIDASGTWSRPNPIGVDGLPVDGELENANRIAYGIPDVLGRNRQAYAGRRVLIVGNGHSAISTAMSLVELQNHAPNTEIFWALRRNRVEKLIGGGLNDQLPERGALGLAAKRAIDAGRVTLLAPFSAERIARIGNGLQLEAILGGKPYTLVVDQIVVATGFRPDFSLLRELRIGLDPVVEAPPALAPLIDPNVHSCGTVRPHGVAELRHPELGLTIVGSKSYGRAPTFLMTTGYEQVRSVVADLVGDHEAARDVRLILPETGVCGVPADNPASTQCCGEPAVAVDTCCADDAAAKAAGQSGCGCSIAIPSRTKNAVGCCP